MCTPTLEAYRADDTERLTAKNHQRSEMATAYGCRVIARASQPIPCSRRAVVLRIAQAFAEHEGRPERTRCAAFDRDGPCQYEPVPVYIGTSGWSYAHWAGVLYPEGLPAERRLDYYVPRFGTTELNASYYKWPTDAAFAHWRRRLPPGFVLSVKAPGALTHQRRLFQPEAWVARVLRGLGRLGPRLGVLLVQLPPSQAIDQPRLAYFLDCLPTMLRVAVEFRNPTWHQESVFRLLEERRAAYCVMSGARLPCILRATTHFVYVRLHGPDPDRLYAGSYPDADLHWWADRVREWRDAGRAVFVYFNNDGNGHAVSNATTLRRMVGA